jgi:hypothetical protein
MLTLTTTWERILCRLSSKMIKWLPAVPFAVFVSRGWAFQTPLREHRRPSWLSVATATSKGQTQKVVPVFDEVCETTGVTLTRFMMEVEKLNPELQELAQLFSGIQTACKAISNLVRRSQLPTSAVLGYEGAINVQGEDQKVRQKELNRSSTQLPYIHHDPCLIYVET